MGYFKTFGVILAACAVAVAALYGVITWYQSESTGDAIQTVYRDTEQLGSTIKQTTDSAKRSVTEQLEEFRSGGAKKLAGTAGSTVVYGVKTAGSYLGDKARRVTVAGAEYVAETLKEPKGEEGKEGTGENPEKPTNVPSPRQTYPPPGPPATNPQGHPEQQSLTPSQATVYNPNISTYGAPSSQKFQTHPPPISSETSYNPNIRAHPVPYQQTQTYFPEQSYGPHPTVYGASHLQTQAGPLVTQHPSPPTAHSSLTSSGYGPHLGQPPKAQSKSAIVSEPVSHKGGPLSSVKPLLPLSAPTQQPPSQPLLSQLGHSAYQPSPYGSGLPPSQPQELATSPQSLSPFVITTTTTTPPQGQLQQQPTHGQPAHPFTFGTLPGATSHLQSQTVSQATPGKFTLGTPTGQSKKVPTITFTSPVSQVPSGGGQQMSQEQEKYLSWAKSAFQGLEYLMRAFQKAPQSLSTDQLVDHIKEVVTAAGPYVQGTNVEQEYQHYCEALKSPTKHQRDYYVDLWRQFLREIKPTIEHYYNVASRILVENGLLQ